MLRLVITGNVKLYLRAFNAQWSSSTCFGRQLSSQPARQEVDKQVPNHWPDITVPNKSILQFLQENLSKFSNEPLGICAVTGLSRTHAEVHERGRKLAASLHSMGLKQNDSVAIVLPNCTEYYSIALAAAHLGALINLVNPIYTTEEIAPQLKSSNVKFVFTISNCGKTVAEAASICPSVKEVFMIDKSGDGCRSLQQLLEDGHNFVPVVNVDPDDAFALPFSSGTTGLPKGVMMTHNNLSANVVQYSYPKITDLGRQDHTFLAVLPFYHCYGISLTVLVNLHFGSRSVILPKFDPELYVKCLRKYKPTFLTIAPPILGFFVNSPLVKPEDLESVETMVVGAAPVTKAMVEKFQAKIPHRINFLEGYGLTETGPVVSCIPVTNQQIGKSGQLLPNTKAKFVSFTDGCALGPNEEGELHVKGPQVMKGYLNNPEATQNTFSSDGWFITGDIGYYDNDGFIKIVDRAKELIKVKGLQVAPAELEALLLKHPSIQDVAVIGVPNERSGEAPRAYVVIKPKTSLSEKEVTDYVAGKVAKHKHLTGGVEFLEIIPKSAAGKILRRVLKNEFIKSEELKT